MVQPIFGDILPPPARPFLTLQVAVAFNLGGGMPSLGLRYAGAQSLSVCLCVCMCVCVSINKYNWSVVSCMVKR